MEKLFLTIILFVLGGMPVAGQDKSAPCTAPQAQQFDFWIGSWDLEWTDADGKKQSGSNIISKILGGCVIEENFSTGGETPYAGKSHPLFDAKSGLWKQTWVDSGGEYLDFTGEFRDGKMTLRREFTGKAGKLIKQRMIFSNIRPDSFEWNWESSVDGGKSWTTNWKIFYKRRS